MALNKTYADKMRPYASRASAALKIPVEAILAQWQLESGSGSSGHAKDHNNHAGIKVPAQREFKGYKRSGTPFAGYKTLDDFTSDYILNMSLGFYSGVRAAGGLEDTITALGASPWDAGHYELNGVKGGKLLNLLGLSVGGNTPGNSEPAQAVCPHCRKPVYLSGSSGA